MRNLSFISLSLLFFGLTSAMAETKNYCFSHHILESISINQQKMPFYSQLTGKKTDPIFSSLITSEHVALAGAFTFDLFAQNYIKNGIDLFCQEFVPMNNRPLDKIGAVESREFVAVDWKQFHHSLEWAINKKNPYLVKFVAENILESLERYPGRYCMLKHMVESIYRIAYFAPQRESEALAKKLPSPKDLIFAAISVHLLTIETSFDLDKIAWPIQNSGIPVLCHELPPLLEGLN